MQRPAGVTILGVLAFIGAGLLVLAALGMFLGGAILANMAARPGMGMIAGAGGVALGVFFLVIAALYAVIGTGMFKLQNWARILVIVLSFLGAFLNALSVLGSLLHLHPLAVLWSLILVAVNVWIAMYLLKPHVKQAFGATGF
jgi:hypothetical protein